MKIGFIAASRRHLNYQEDVAARDFYSVSPLFRYSLAYCEANYDQTYILTFGSPKILTPDDGVLLVDTRVDQLSKAEKKEWSRMLSESLKQLAPEDSEIYVHLPKSYKMIYEWWKVFYSVDTKLPTSMKMANHKIFLPMAGMSIGQQLHFYKSSMGQLPSVQNEEVK
jgi:hypothetical protein